MSVLVQLVVCQLDFLEGNHLFHELLPGERRVRVDVESGGGEGERRGEEVDLRILIRQFNKSAASVSR